MSDNQGYVYAIYSEDRNLVKIGRCRFFGDRAKSIKRQYQLMAEVAVLGIVEVEDCVKAETALHRHFKPYCVGGEWFDIEQEVLHKFFKLENINILTRKVFENEYLKKTTAITVRLDEGRYLKMLRYGAEFAPKKTNQQIMVEALDEYLASNVNREQA